MRYDADHKERTRERVLQEAVKAIRKDGPAKLGVASVMADAGLTHGGFYAHFKSRDELMLAAIGQMFGDVRGLFEKRTAGLEPKEALRAYIGFYLSRTHRDMRDGGCPLPVLSSDLPRMDAAAREQFAGGVARLSGALQRLLEETGQHDAEALAGSALCEMIGALAIARGVADPAQSDAILARSRASILKRLGLEDRP
jgi:TetR/AcrR family transcriptional repressor of nem operon